MSIYKIIEYLDSLPIDVVNQTPNSWAVNNVPVLRIGEDSFIVGGQPTIYNWNGRYSCIIDAANLILESFRISAKRRW
jgi:hypothetical protein